MRSEPTRVVSATHRAVPSISVSLHVRVVECVLDVDLLLRPVRQHQLGLHAQAPLTLYTRIDLLPVDRPLAHYPIPRVRLSDFWHPLPRSQLVRANRVLNVA